MFILLAGGTASADPTFPGRAPFHGRFAFRVYTEDDGLGPQNVDCLLQDRTGFLWIGTQGGLTRFDGRHFVRFAADSGLPSTMINVLHETATGALYVGTDGGLARFDNGRFITIGAANGLPDGGVFNETLASDSQGRLFVGKTEGLFVGAGDTFRHVALPAGIENGPVAGLHVAPDGVLYFGRGKKLLALKNDVVIDVGRDKLLPEEEEIGATSTDADGRLWVRSNNHLWVLAPGAARFDRDDHGLPPAVFRGRLALDDQGQIMVPTSAGLARKSPDGWRIIDKRHGLVTDLTSSAIVDREGSLWIGLIGGGVARQLGSGSFSAWTRADGLSHDLVWSIARQPVAHGTGPLWVGTQAGLDRVDPVDGSVTAVKLGDDAESTAVLALIADPDGTVWAGRYQSGGVARVGPEPGSVRIFGADDLGLQDFRVEALLRGPGGELWAGCREGAYRLEPKMDVFRRVRVGDGPQRSKFRKFTVASDGNVYGASEHGLVRLTGGAPRRYATADGLRTAGLLGLLPLPDGTMLVAYTDAPHQEIDRVTLTPGGIAVSPVASMTDFPDLPAVVGMDAAGNTWVGSVGLDVFASDGSRRHYGKLDGLPGEDVAQNAFLADADGSVWIGTTRGLVHYVPERVERRHVPPPVVFTSIQAGDRLLQAGSPAVLDRGERDLSVSWAALTFVDPQSVRYEYRLAGLSSDPHTTTRDQMIFSQLPSGHYRLEVVAVAASGVRSTRPAVFEFSVRPALWERWWAYVGYVLGAGACVFGLIRFRESALQRRNRELEERVRQRTLDLDDKIREVEAARNELAARNQELAAKNEELVASHRRADRIFSALAEALPGSVLDGKYRIDAGIGKGGYAAVFRGMHLGLGRPVAIKVFRPVPGNDSAEALERFRREGMTTSKLNHPNVVQVFDSGISADGIAYIIMELLDGQTLKEYMAAPRPLSLQRVAQIIKPVCDALDAAHGEGLIHRDIKPDNVFLHNSPSGEVVKVLDFGIAKAFEPQGAEAALHTRTGSIPGTPAYMAPERLTMSETGPASDVYSVGVLTYYLLAGRLPFKGTHTEVALQKLTEAPPSLMELNPRVTPEIDALVLRALRKDPDLRPTAREFARQLVEAVESAQARTRSAGPMPGADGERSPA